MGMCKWRCESFGFVELQEDAVRGGEGAERNETGEEAVAFILHVNTPCCQARTPERCISLRRACVYMSQGSRSILAVRNNTYSVYEIEIKCFNAL